MKIPGAKPRALSLKQKRKIRLSELA